jgi:flagellar P-ring protein precursor FlgI
MLENMGVRVDEGRLKIKNAAAVMVTAKMPVSSQPGSPLDVTISSIGDASSLVGGVLLLTPLKGVDGKIYALAQGPLLVGGYAAGGEAASAAKNVTTVAKIPAGAVVERPVPFQFNTQEELSINLATRDFSTTKRILDKINDAMGGDYARAQNVSTVRVRVPERFQGDLVPLVASLENLDVTPDSKARVVVDENTGTVVLGANVTMSRVAVTHGNLHVVVKETPQVSQPGPFSDGETVVVPETQLEVREERRNLVLVEGATIQELVDGLNRIGASPRDIMSVLMALKSAGALHAELEVI